MALNLVGARVIPISGGLNRTVPLRIRVIAPVEAILDSVIICTGRSAGYIFVGCSGLAAGRAYRLVRDRDAAGIRNELPIQDDTTGSAQPTIDSYAIINPFEGVKRNPALVSATVIIINGNRCKA